MIPDHLLPQSATWVTPGAATDVYGNTLPDWDAATSITIRCRLQQKTRDETDDETRDALVQTALLWTNTTGLAGRDRVVVGGVTWELDGPPALVSDGVGTHHLEATVRRVAG